MFKSDGIKSIDKVSFVIQYDGTVNIRIEPIHH